MSQETAVILMKTDGQQPTAEQVWELVELIGFPEVERGLFLTTRNGPLTPFEDEQAEITIESQSRVSLRTVRSAFERRLPHEAYRLYYWLSTPFTNKICDSLKISTDGLYAGTLEPVLPTLVVGPCSEIVHDGEAEDISEGSAFIALSGQGGIPLSPMSRYDEAVEFDAEIQRFLLWLKDHWGGNWRVFSTCSY